MINELFNMKERESITSMLYRFSEIMNGLSSLGRYMDDSEKVKKNLEVTSTRMGLISYYNYGIQ